MSTYIRPSQCEQCVPVETYGDNTTDLAHEPSCPNTRKETKQ